MPRSVPVVFLAGLLGAGLGVAVALSIGPTRTEPTVPPPIPTTDLERAFRAALLPFENQLATDLADLRSELASIAKRSPPAKIRTDHQEAPAATLHGGTPPIVRAPEHGLPPPRPEAFEALRDWDTKPEVRRTWLFASEAEILDHFGTPDRIAADGMRETWTWVNRGEGVEHVIVLNRGRVIE